MAWLAVDKNEEEYIYEEKPERGGEQFSSTSELINIPKGTIAKLLRYDMKWEDEPVELK